MKKTNPLWIGLIAIAFSCSQSRPEESSIDASELKTEAPVQQASLTKAQLAETPVDLYSDGRTKLIKTANYRFEVKDIKKSTEAIEATLKKYPAYISSSEMKLENPILETKLTIKVQNEYFQDVLKEIDLQAVFINFRNITTEDVSKDIVDLESRLRTKREVEDRYREILRTKAGSIKEVLEAEQQIGALHEEIEAAISRITFLRDQVKYSTINLEYYQQVTQEIAHVESGTTDKFKKAFTTGWGSLVGIVLALAYIWPLIILTGGGYWMYKSRKRKMVATMPG